MWRRLCLRLVGGLLLSFAALPVQAHPHVFINNVTFVVFEQGRVVGLRMEWTFDEIFSFLILEDFDPDRDKSFDAPEIETLRRDAFSNLAHFSYFTHVRLGGRKFAIEEVTDFTATVRDGSVMYSFFVPFSDPVDPRGTQVDFSVHDESFYVAVDLDRQDPVRLQGQGSQSCHYEIRDDKGNPIYFGLVIPKKIDLICATS